MNGLGIATSSFVPRQNHIQIIISSLEMRLLLELYLVPIAIVTAILISLARGWATFSLKLYPHFRYYTHRDIIVKEFRAGTMIEATMMIVAALFVPSIWWIVPIQLAVVSIFMLLSGSLSFHHGSLNLPIT
jgi:hypothetical protein